MLGRRSYAIRPGVSTGFQLTGRPVTADRQIPQHRRIKRWEREGRNKDDWFREKYAHVHAREKARRDDRMNSNVDRPSQSNRVPRPNVKPRLLRNPLVEYIYGTNAVYAALHGGRRSISRLLYHGEISRPVRQLCEAIKLPCKLVDKHELNLLTKSAVHNNLVLETKPFNPPEILGLGPANPDTGLFEYTNEISETCTAPFMNSKRKFPLGIYLDEVQDPHNLGAIIRSAYYLGADFVALSRRNCCPMTPAVAKSSSGALEYLSIYQIERPLRFFESSAETWVFVAAHTGSKVVAEKTLEVSDLHRLCDEAPTVLVLGNEGDGIRTNLLHRSDFFVKIPRAAESAVDSLNVSVSAGILINALANA